MIVLNKVSKFRVAAVQLVSDVDPAINLREVAARVAEAAQAGAQLVALPEYFALMSQDESAKLRLAEADGEGPLQAFLSGLAAEHRVWLVGGTIPLRSAHPDKVFNATLVYDDTGARVARYDKVHLFSFQTPTEHYDEARTIEAGREVVTFDAPFGRAGLAICYDLRFPEFFRSIGDVALTILPAAFTETTGRCHWEALLRARAIENQCYILASAQGGLHACGRRTWGESMLIDPWGTILDRLPVGPGIVVGDIDLEYLAQVRESLPVHLHRRF